MNPRTVLALTLSALISWAAACSREPGADATSDGENGAAASAATARPAARLAAASGEEGTGAAVPSAALARGREVYEREKCAACHSIAGEGNTRSPLDGVGARLTREELRKWVVAPREMKPTVRKPAYDMPEDDLSALVAYLAAGPAAAPAAR